MNIKYVTKWDINSMIDFAQGLDEEHDIVWCLTTTQWQRFLETYLDTISEIQGFMIKMIETGTRIGFTYDGKIAIATGEIEVSELEKLGFCWISNTCTGMHETKSDTADVTAILTPVISFDTIHNVTPLINDLVWRFWEITTTNVNELPLLNVSHEFTGHRYTTAVVNKKLVPISNNDIQTYQAFQFVAGGNGVEWKVNETTRIPGKLILTPEVKVIREIATPTN